LHGVKPSERLVGAVDEVVGQRFQWRCGVAEGCEGGVGVGDELSGVVFGLLDAVDSGPGGFDGGSIFTGGFAKLFGGLGHVEDVVDDLEGEAGGFAEGTQAGDGVFSGAGERCSCCEAVAEAEEAAADDGGGDEGAGLGAMDALDEVGGGSVAFAFDVHYLAADHAGRKIAGYIAADAGADGEGEFAEDFDEDGGGGGDLRDGLEGEGLEGVAG